MFRRMTIVIVMCVVVMMSGAKVAQANVLVNGDFETGDTAGWAKDAPGPGTAAVNTVRPASGAYSFEFDKGPGTFTHYANIAQDGLVVNQPRLQADVYLDSFAGGGGTVTVAAYLNCYRADGVLLAQIYYAWINCTSWGTGILGPFPDGHLQFNLATNMGNTTGEWMHLDRDIAADLEAQWPWQTYAGLGVDHINFLFQAWCGENPLSRVHGFVDNLSLTEVPEPMTISLLAMGFVGTILRRKR